MSDRARVLLFDIEATDLEASFGHVLCIGYRYWTDKKARVVSLQDLPRAKKSEEPDAPLMRWAHDLLTNKADVIVTWYGKEYDRKFLNSRMLLAGLSPLPPLSSEHVDLYFACRGNFKLHSNRLQAFSEAMGCPVSKTPVRADVWRKAMRGDPGAMKYVIDHCKRDVDILHWAYEVLRPYVRRHPPVSEDAGACRVCGETRWRSNGWRFRIGGRHQRLQCQSCGHWTYLNEKGMQVA